jgi:hypothetical protein
MRCDRLHVLCCHFLEGFAFRCSGHAAAFPVGRAIATNEDEVDDTEASTATGIDLLPPDHDDPFWDGLVCGKTRRQLLALALGLAAFRPFTRAEVVAAIASRLHCTESMIELRPGRDDPPWQFDWVPTITIHKPDYFNYGSLC